MGGVQFMGYLRRLLATCLVLLIGVNVVVNAQDGKASNNEISLQTLATQSVDNDNYLSQEIRFEFEKTQISDLINLIENKTDIKFSYQVDLFDGNDEIVLQKTTMTVGAVLELIAQDQKITYRVLPDGFVVWIDNQKQTGTLTGRVTDSETEKPLPGAQIYIEKLERGAVADEEGNFEIEGLPVGTYKVDISFLGYQTMTRNVEINEGEVTNVNFELKQEVLGIDEVVVTGVIGEMNRRDVPFSVARVTSETFERVSYSNVKEALRGKVAGARISLGSGRPGSDPSIQLRGATTLLSDRSEEPLIVVDGVIHDGMDINDISTMDVKSVEVVKGAAAASIYGARAAQGVINVITKRGESQQEGHTEVKIRSEYSVNGGARTGDYLGARHHHYMVNDNNEYIDPDGNVIENPYESGERYPDERFVDGVSFAVNDYPRYIDQFDHFVERGHSYLGSASVSYSQANTNFFGSVNYSKESGVIPYDDGTNQLTGRLNLDHDVSEDFRTSLSLSYSDSEQDLHIGPDPIYSMVNFRPDVNVTRDNPDGTRYIVNPDASTGITNPLHTLYYGQNRVERNDFQGSIQLSYYPFDVLELQGRVGYDRNFSRRVAEYPTEMNTVSSLDDDPDNDVWYAVDGGMQINNSYSKSWNVNLDAVYSDIWFENLNVDAQLRYSTDEYNTSNNTVSGNNFSISNYFSFGNATNYFPNPSNSENIRIQESVRLIGGLKWDNRYILDFAVRNEGSSHFGPENDRTTFYRGSFAWRMSNEDWWPFDAITELKPRYSVGTAGNRPSERAKYEQYSVFGSDFTISSPANPRLTAENALEHEVGLEVFLWDRLFFDGTYAQTNVDNALLSVPLASYTGFSSQLQNVGSLTSNSLELSLRGIVAQSEDFSAEFTLMWDRQRSEITSLNRDPFSQGTIRGRERIEEGLPLDNIYGAKLITEMNQLAPQFMNDQGDLLVQNYSQYFDINNQGYVVPVGQGNTWRDGISEQLWGSEVEITDENGNVVKTYQWGMPVQYVDEEGDSQHVLGTVTPDWSMSFSSDIQWHSFSLYFLLDGWVGSSKSRNSRTYRSEVGTNPALDQTGKPQEEWKPVSYYDHLSSQFGTNSHFVRENSTLTLRTLSLSYRMNRGLLQRWFGDAISNFKIGVTARDLFTISTYEGFNTNIGRAETFNYPFYKTYTGFVEIRF